MILSLKLKALSILKWKSFHEGATVQLCRIARTEMSVVKNKHYLLGYFSQPRSALPSGSASCLESFQKEKLLLSLTEASALVRVILSCPSHGLQYLCFPQVSPDFVSYPCQLQVSQIFTFLPSVPLSIESKAKKVWDLVVLCKQPCWHLPTSLPFFITENNISLAHMVLNLISSYVIYPFVRNSLKVWLIH